MTEYERKLTFRAMFGGFKVKSRSGVHRDAILTAVGDGDIVAFISGKFHRHYADMHHALEWWQPYD